MTDNPLIKMKTALEARVKAEPKNADAWRELAQVKMMLGDAEGAENDCIESLRIDPKNAAALVLMGNLLTNMRGDDAAAEQYYVRAVEADDGFASAHANYGTLLLKRGEKMKAVTATSSRRFPARTSPATGSSPGTTCPGKWPSPTT